MQAQKQQECAFSGQVLKGCTRIAGLNFQNAPKTPKKKKKQQQHLHLAPCSKTTKPICSRLAMVASMPAGQRLRVLIKDCSFSRRIGLLKTCPDEFSSLTCYSSGRAGKRRLLQVALQQQNIFIPCFWTGNTKRGGVGGKGRGTGWRWGGGEAGCGSPPLQVVNMIMQPSVSS